MDTARAFRAMREVSNKNERLVARHCDHTKRPLSPASPGFPSWNGSAVVVILPALIPLCGEVILFYHRLQTSE